IKVVQKSENGQVPIVLLEEMRRIEKERISKLIFGKYKNVAFRKCKASEILSTYISKRKWWYRDWLKIANIELEEAEVNRIKALKKKVMTFRYKLMKENLNISQINDVEGQNEFFFRPVKPRCYICQVCEHRTVDCMYRYDRVLKKMNEDVNLKMEKIMVNNSKKTEYVDRMNNKRMKNIVVDAK
ncbi:hypothetical protein COBT_003979, partial [Conglomerata obtusa]